MTVTQRNLTYLGVVLFFPAPNMPAIDKVCN